VAMERLFATVRELASPATWSAGVELARNAEIHELPAPHSDDRLFRMLQGARDKTVTVTLSESNEAWQCDCGSDEDPCRHVIAAILAVRQGKVGRDAKRPALGSSARVVHTFKREEGRLSFARELRIGDRIVPVRGALAVALEGLKRQGVSAAVSEDERLLDHVLVGAKEGVLPPRNLGMLLRALSRVHFVELDGSPVTVAAEALVPIVVVEDDAQGYRVRREFPVGTGEVFGNGAALRDQVLYSVEDSALSHDEVQLLSGKGTAYPESEGVALASRLIPALQAKAQVRFDSRKFPRARTIKPRIVIETVSDEAGEQLTVIPHLVYGDPPIAEVRAGQLRLSSQREIPVRDSLEESRLERELNGRLMLRLNEAKVFSGASAARFAGQLQSWEVSGDAARLFSPTHELKPVLAGDGREATIEFVGQSGARVPLSQALAALRAGQPFVQVEGADRESGRWGTLPAGWMAEHRDILERILAAKADGSGAVRPMQRLLADVQAIHESLGGEAPPYFERLMRGLAQVEQLPLAILPEGLTATLRGYQERGVAWLSFLREHELCGLLADDMGLGKTLQALCVVRPRTLIVAPTSVLSSWREQVSRFRPGLSTSLYHGPSRSLGDGADVILTSYAIMRLDIETLSSLEWDAVILDESQTIRNPDSQVARAAFRLKSSFRISLSGTPIENSLSDLWSQFHFLQPGLLGSRAEFEREFAAPIVAGSTERARELKRRVSPFVLRRLKRDVATELPPKTEVVLECELSEAERAVYGSVLAGARAQADRYADGGANALSVLEALLRLRQACCHCALVPGLTDSRSSKVELLLESLRNSRDQGHRSLVFSQWTSLLDLIEPRLREEGLSFVRIDGSTEGRGDIVESFQRSDGPDLMLLSLKAGGLGLTLTAADHVYIVDPWWNPAAEDQAADRAYRIGQENPVIVHRLVARDTVEERILALQARKRALSQDAIGERSEVGLSPTELRALLG
jgi:hypothetical protein